MRYFDSFKPARKDESFEIFKVPLLNARLCEHIEQLTKQVVDGSNLDTELSGYPQRLGLDHLTLLELLDA